MLQLKVLCANASGFGGPGAGPCQEEQKGSAVPTTGVIGSGAAMRVSTSAPGEAVLHLNVGPLNGIMGTVSTRY